MENKKEEIFYFDANDKMLPNKDGAVKIIINEYDEDGELEQSTTLFKADK
ncbi:MAG: hypothetical protein HFF36_02885 [Coprobacillus sp.]|nr:hypothetical protein [Coprobacillus sp.]